jgi:hypothetical protein
MPYQNISAALSDADLEAIQASLATLESKLPFLVSLTNDERRKRVKFGDKSLAFVENCLSVTEQNPDILPASFAKDEFKKDVLLLRQLVKVMLPLQQVCEKVADTETAVGTEAMQAALLVYDYAKSAQKHNAGMKTVVDQLGQRFKSMGQRTTNTNTANE